jgi:PTH1 family peptidyl-tRNA hydrolase
MERPVRRLVVGLGNPGPDYQDTRHNVGFTVLDHLALHEGLLFESPPGLDGYDGPGDLACARVHDPDALLVKPLAFMNRSGEVVRPLLEWAGLGPEDLMVVFDDMDLPVGALRLRPHGGAGGQKGMRSIIDHLETDRFPRLRIGIGRPRTDAARHVLSTFSPEEREAIADLPARAAEAILFWLRTGDIERCMTRFHSRWIPSAPPEDPAERAPD